MRTSHLVSRWLALPRPRRDGSALGFGLAFIAFGGACLAREAGAHLPVIWLYPIILISLGVAGLVSVIGARRG